MLTIITPVYNCIRFIEFCIINVIEQKCPDLEHIIVDGGSTDGTVEVIKRYAQQYHHIRWVSEKDKGQSDAMNKGVQLARGEILGFLNADDYYESGALSYVLDRIIHLPEPTLVVGNCNVWDDDGNLSYVSRPNCISLKNMLLGKYIEAFPMNASSYFYHKSLHERIGLYDINEHQGMDLHFIFKAVQSANVTYIDKTFGNYRYLQGTKSFISTESGTADICVNMITKYYLRQQSWYYRICLIAIVIRAAVVRCIRNSCKIIKNILLQHNVFLHIRNGKIPWSSTYNDYQIYIINSAITDNTLLEKCERNDLLPVNYGIGVDERCVEYPWLFANLPVDATKILDAGSVLNYEYILQLPMLHSSNLTIMTLSPERKCFFSKKISYIYADLRDIPIKDDYYDAIVCISTLEHIGLNNTCFTQNEKYNENSLSDYAIVMKELRRILKPRGTLLFSVPFGKYSHLGMQQQFDRTLLTNCIDAFGETHKIVETFYRYKADGWQRATDVECAECQYVEWISRIWEYGTTVPRHVPIEPDLAAAARAVACVLMIK